MIYLSKDYVINLLKKVSVEPLSLPVPPAVDHADHMLKTALAGYTKLAADHILHYDMKNMLLDVLGSFIRRANLVIRSESLSTTDLETLNNRILRRARIYDTVIELIMNLVGVESRWSGFDEETIEEAITILTNALSEWEDIERIELGSPNVLLATIELNVKEMLKVNKGKSLVAEMARKIMNSIDMDAVAKSFVLAVRNVFTENVYRKSYEKGLCKFGNDYALGLRWLRHLGYVQVSTNPVLAGKAYDDDPDLWNRFIDYARNILSKKYPEWFKDPDRYADDIAMEATRFALLDNFYVFRVPFILSRYHDGLVSYQLNPLIANNVEKSVEAAKIFAMRLEEDLKIYDEYLWWGYNVSEKGRPNLVIKVAAGYPESIEIAERLNEIGIGQNITVSYTVAQEVLVAFGAMKGMAKAVKKGIIPTQTYDTNMGGRLEDHLREDIAAKLLMKALENVDEDKKMMLLEKLAKGLKVDEATWTKIKSLNIRDIVDYLCSHRVLGRDLIREPYIEVLAETGAYGSREDVLKMLKPLEMALKLSGTYVAQRVYEILFSPWNREKWIEYLVREFGIRRDQAEMILDRIDLLPASKRKPIDTLYTYASRNMTNTEFPDHQLSVVNEVVGKSIRLDDLAESIYQELPKEYLDILMQYEDFVKAYEASPEVVDLLKKVGINKDYGYRGVSPKDWPTYGPCAKTLKEFTNSYIAFRERVVNAIKELSKSLNL
ncbi:MAG: transaldolase family protein [Ignisphaera sp.]